MAVVRTIPSDGLGAEAAAELRRLLDAAWRDDPEGFSDEDWDHALGGVHFVVEEGGAPLAHASVVERELHASGHHLATGYVEAVATSPAHRGRGYGSLVMRRVGEHIDRAFQLGALGGDPGFYERLGWVVWEGPTFVRTPSGLVRTSEEDGSVLVRPTPATPELDPLGPISCDWRPGDVW